MSWPSSILGSLGPSHQQLHMFRASLWDPPCAHSVACTFQGEVCIGSHCNSGSKNINDR